MLEAFRVPAFARFWSAAAVSNIGNWMQTITVPFVIYKLTDSRQWLGATALATFIPSIAGTLISTGIVDRYERRRLLLVLQNTQMAIAVTLFATWALGFHEPYAFLALAAIGGLVGGVTSPAWNSYVPLLVPRDLMPSAIRLNSMQFAVGRSIGPLIAAAVLKPWGPGATFGVNAVSFVLVIAVLASFPVTRPVIGDMQSPLREAIEGWRHVFSRRRLLVSPVTVFVCGFFGSSIVQLAAAVVDEQFHRDRSQIGVVVSAFGAGSIIGSVLVTAVGNRWRRSRVVYLGMLAWVGGLGLLSSTETLTIGIIALVTMGFAHVVTATSVNTSIQVQVAEQFRGRAIAAYLQGFFLGVALGAFALARIADAIELRGAFLLGSCAIAAFCVLAFAIFDRMRVLDGDAPASNYAS